MRRMIVTGLAIAGAACAPAAPATAPDRGTVTIGVVTSGPALQGLRFQVRLDNGVAVKTIDADAGVASLSLAPGDHRLTLVVPDRCQVEGGAERRVTVAADRVVPLRFTVRCR